MSAGIPVLDLTIPQEGDCEPVIREILAVIRPKWTMEDIIIEVVEGGVMNRLWKCHLGDKEDAILVKKYAMGSDAYLDRTMEFRIMSVLSQEGIIMPIYAKFNNGIAYKFKPGNILAQKQLLDRHISRLAMEKMHQVHAIDIKRIMPDKLVDTFDSGFIPLVNIFKNEMFDHLDEDERYKTTFPKRSTLLAELDACTDIYKELCEEFPRCLTHMDTHCLNIVYDPKTDDLAFLDWEIAGYACEIGDLSVYLTRDVTMTGRDNGVDFATDTQLLKEYVRMYLEGHASFKDGEISDDLVRKWTKGVLRSTYVNHMAIVPFAYLQDVTNKADYDVIAFAIDSYKAAQDVLKVLEEDAY